MLTEIEATEIRHRRGPSGVEALARLRAEAKLIRRHATQYQKFRSAGDHVSAVRDLVKRHVVEYGNMVRDERTRAEQGLASTGRAA